MKKQQQHKLSAYSAMPASVYDNGAQADAQIVFTNVDPDIIDIGPIDVPVDIDNNGDMDFDVWGWQFIMA